jgi:hypothetical protein
VPTSQSRSYEDFLTDIRQKMGDYSLVGVIDKWVHSARDKKQISDGVRTGDQALGSHAKKNPANRRDCSMDDAGNSVCSGGFADSPGLYAVRADSNSLHAAVHDRPDPLQVRHEASRCPIMCMTHIVSCHRFLATHITNSCHHLLQLIR